MSSTRSFSKKRQQKGQRKQLKKAVEEEVESLKKRILEEAPPKGILYYKYNQNNVVAEESKVVSNRKVVETADKTKVKIRFTDLPVSRQTIKGLNKARFIKLTEVQRATLPHALSGRDAVVCSRTGSGKTLSYLVAVVERMFREKWLSIDGLGALIIVPTRELAI